MTDPKALRRIVDQLRRIHQGDAWHGPSLKEALDGVTAELAVRHPVPGAHSIYELTHHCAAWVNEVSERLEGRAPQMPDEGDFPAPVDSLTATEWESTLGRLDAAHARLVEVILAFDPERLHERIGLLSDDPAGPRVSFHGMLLGLIQHDAYHAGQMVLLRKALA